MATTKKSEVKKGYLCTEFYLSAAAAILGIIIASGVVDPEGLGTWDKIVGMACSLLAAVGYTVGRSKVKAAAEENK
tara:strand:+ start:227 stop:454 length:228 start_codon:yes stop_codon:yes gene_type:complete